MTKPTPPAAEAPDVHLHPDIISVMRLSADIQRASSRHLKTLWREKGLTERGLYILELVHAGLDRPTRLIEYFDVLPSTITFETEKLVAAGLLVRKPLPTDRRVVQLSLTRKGLKLHREMTEALNDFMAPRLAGIPQEELKAALATFEKIVDPMPPSSMARQADDGRKRPRASRSKAA